MSSSTLPEQITEEVARAALNKAVEEYGPDWIDPNNGVSGASLGCVNVYPYKGSVRMCIAARAFFHMGFSTSEIETVFPGDSGGDLVKIQELYDIRATSEAVVLLNEAQGRQDDGSPWGECVLSHEELAEQLEHW